MTPFQAQQLLNNRLYVDAVLEYRRRPIETTDRTYRRAVLWLEAANTLTRLSDQ